MLYVSWRDHFHCPSEPRLTHLSSNIRGEPVPRSKKAFQRRSIFGGEEALTLTGRSTEPCPLRFAARRLDAGCRGRKLPWIPFQLFLRSGPGGNWKNLTDRKNTRLNSS